MLNLSLEKAKRLLAANHFSMADIALESGFGSQAHFTKCFTKWLEPHPALTVGVWGVVSRTGAEIEKTLGRNLKDWPALRNYTE